MGLMDKFKNLFTEEVEEEIEEKEEEPIKKETIHVEIPSPKPQEEKEEVKAPVVEEKKEDDFKFPFFDDEDFTEIEVKPKEEKKKRFERKEKREVREVYNPVKEEKKVFKPTPIISPVYGILDKNYQKEDIKSKTTRRSYYDSKEASVDEIRNKAYGTLEDEIDTTLFGRNRLIFDELPKEDATEEVEDIKNEEIGKTTEIEDNIIGERPRHGDNAEPELTELLEAELDKNESKEEQPHKISDRELFNMIDSMYQNGGKKDD